MHVRLKRVDRQAEKRADARERQRAYDALTVDEKIAHLDRCGFTATKQRARLERQRVSKNG